MEKKRINVVSPSIAPYEEYIEEIKSIWNTKWLTNNGPKHKEFEEKISELMQAQAVCLTANGHLALEIALQALDMKKGGEIITTPFTFSSTTLSIIRSGFKPVFCDIDENTFCIDSSKIEALINENTVAIVPVHVYGAVCNVVEIEKIAKKHNLKVLYDAAHAFDVKLNGKDVSSFGDASCFSFHSTKVFNTVEGGCIVTSFELKEKAETIKNFGAEGEDNSFIGTNGKMSEFHSAMGLCNLRHHREQKEKRKLAFEQYNNLLSGVKGLKTLPLQERVSPNYAYYPIVFNDEFGKTREDVIEDLEKNNIFPRKYFYPLTNELSAIAERFEKGDTPIAKSISERVLCLPLYADLTQEEVKRICEIILL